MLIHWKALFGFGLAFWMLLCLNEILVGTKGKNLNFISDFDEIYDKNFLSDLTVKKKAPPPPPTEDFQQRGIKFGLSLLLWNTLAFVFSILFCSLLSTLSWIFRKMNVQYRVRHQQPSIRLTPVGGLPERVASKIPVMIKSNSTAGRSSDTNIKLKQSMEAETSCPNLTPLKRSSSSISQNAVARNCRTLFTNSKLLSPANEGCSNVTELQCARMREEMIRMQANSLKEHAATSKKMESAAREKRELSKLLTVAQKENRAAKQQLDELLQERNVLMKRLENATKEFKCNTKTKKFALARLEEATAAVDELKQQLEQVTRDKEILENKLRMLECEYEKLQERLIINQNHDSFAGFHENTPERDLNGIDHDRSVNNTASQFDEGICNNEDATRISTVSQTELDMKKIELKIKQLERNLENFNTTKSELNFPTGDREESDLSLSVRENHTDSQTRTDDEGEISENPFLNNPRFRYWGGRAGDLVGRKEQFAKIQVLATRMHDRVRCLENIKEGRESIRGTDNEDLSSPESMEEIHSPKRIVSSSVAFQNFLRSLHSSESIKRQFGSHSNLYF